MEENLQTEVQTEEVVSAGATFTQEDFDRKLQAEADRRVEMALQKERKKFQSQMAEAEKLRTMNEEQKAQYEYEQRMKALEDKEKEFSLRENKIEASKILQEKGLPVEMVDYLTLDDAGVIMDTINRFELMFNAAVNDTVSRRIASPTPKTSSTPQTGLTKEKFKSLSLVEQLELNKNNPALYRELSK